MTEPFWEVDPDNQHDYWVSFLDAHMGDPESRWYRASVKWDGCIHFMRYYNTPMIKTEKGWDGPEKDYIHICDLDEYIERLRELSAKAKKYYESRGCEWPGA